jgi:hypothetical protein
MKKPAKHYRAARPKLRKNAHKKGKTPNPAAGLRLDTALTDMVGTMTVSAALTCCTLSEKLLIAALIPTLRKLIRTLPRKQLDKALESLYPPTTTKGVPEA